MIRLDSHQHFWQVERGDYGWLTPALGVLYKDFLPADYLTEHADYGITGTVLVQAAETVEETHFMLGLANNTPWILGVVGWVDFDAHDVLDTLAHLAAHKKFLGVRPMLQDIEDTDWILNPDFAPVFTYLVENKLTFDALIQPRHLKNIVKLAEMYPGLRIVIDHCAKPNIEERQLDDWQADMAAFKSHKNVFVKFSGLTTEAAKEDTEAAVYKPYFDILMQIFGPDRIMWGSDWPVIKLKSDLPAWVDICGEIVGSLPRETQAAFWHRNAERFYKLKSAKSI